GVGAGLSGLEYLGAAEGKGDGPDPGEVRQDRAGPRHPSDRAADHRVPEADEHHRPAMKTPRCRGEALNLRGFLGDQLLPAMLASATAMLALHGRLLSWLGNGGRVNAHLVNGRMLS